MVVFRPKSLETSRTEATPRELAAATFWGSLFERTWALGFAFRIYTRRVGGRDTAGLRFSHRISGKPTGWFAAQWFGF